jgi:glycosyltransferase involved in cell wall biosynthesis
MPRVSVVVSTYDRLALLVEALDSIGAQTYRDFDVVVVNDCGKEASTIVADFAARNPDIAARYDHRPENRGVAATRNRGVQTTSGELVAYLDDDDLWTTDHLEVLVGALDAAAPAGAALAYGDAVVWRMEGDPAEPATARIAARLPLAVPFSLEDLARDDFIVPGGMIHTRELYDVIGLFDESLFVSDDWDWLLRVAAARGPSAFARVAHTLIVVRIFGTGANLSADFGSRRWAALAEIERRHGTPPLEPKTFWEVARTYAP